MEVLHNLVGRSRAMRNLRARIRALADLPTTVLITGETGTGKSEVARALHLISMRRHLPLTMVDCGAIAPSLIESELFGHEAGAFTGAGSQRKGRLEAAGGGTLFLDEVAELPVPLQSRLLRALEDRTFERVGGSTVRSLSARVVAATNTPLERAVREGSFRADLFYRLDVVRLEVPPLRGRSEDLTELVDHGLARLCARLGRKPPRPGTGFLERLEHHDWPGNVRELRNVLERVLVHGVGDRLEAWHLDAALPGRRGLEERADEGEGGGGGNDPIESVRIAAILRESGGNVSRAARRLGLARTSLRRRIEKYGLWELLPRD
jgi:DNA-binding NtrC family response regulator